MTRVIILSNLYPPYVVGGAELIASYLAEELACRGHEVHVITTSDRETVGITEDWRNGVKIHRFFAGNGDWLFNNRPQSKLGRAIWHARDAYNSHAERVVGRLIDKLQPEVFHTHNIDGLSPAVWHAARKRNIPVIHTSHDYHLICPRSTLLTGNGEICVSPNSICRIPYRGWYRRLMRNVQVFCSPSETLIDLHRRCNYEPGRYQLVHNGIPLNLLSPRPLRHDHLRFLFIGRLDRYKGVLLLVQMMARLPKDLTISLDVAGTGPLEPVLLNASKDDHRIKVHGFVSGTEKAALFRNNDVLLFPSLWYENAPTVIFEAKASSLAIIGTDLGGGKRIYSPRC